MLKNFISIVLSTAVASLLSISAIAKDVTVRAYASSHKKMA